MSNCSKLFVLLMICNSCSNGRSGVEYKVSEWETVPVQKIPIETLEKNIAEYDGQYIETEGTFHEEYSMYSIVPDNYSKTDLLGLWLGVNKSLSISDDDLKNLLDKRIRVRGKIDKQRKGNLGEFGGSISEVYYIKKVN
ncbi:MAG: hypothetical protein ACJ749_17785 [Flavisolibacter sp.]